MNPITAATTALRRRRTRRFPTGGASTWQLLVAELRDAVGAVRRRFARRP